MPVDIGKAYFIVVYQRELTYTASGKGFHHIAAHATKAKYSHMGIFQFFHSSISQQKPGAAKAFHRHLPFFFHPTTKEALCQIPVATSGCL